MSGAQLKHIRKSIKATPENGQLQDVVYPDTAKNGPKKC